MGIGKKKQSSTDETIKNLYDINELLGKKNLLEFQRLAEQHIKAGGSGVPKSVVDGVIQMLVVDYLFGYGIFKQT